MLFTRRRLVIALAAVILVPAFIFTLWAGITLTYTYSDGTRTGYVQKLSRKGWLCKTWEGELAMTPLPGVAPQIFAFTVRDDSVARAINTLGGRLVQLHYREHRGVPSRCFGETNHFVDGVTSAGR
jgi:hypothetical protein